MKHQLIYLILALCMTMIGCNKTPIGVNTYDIDYGETVTFDQNKKLTFVDVVSDSRCPIEVHCVWAGEATIALQAICTPADTINFELSFGDGITDHREATIFQIYRVELLEVLPLTEEGVELEKEDYSIRVLIEKS